MFYLLSDSEGSFILEKYSIFYTTFDSFLTHVKSTVENIFGFPLNQKKKKKTKLAQLTKSKIIWKVPIGRKESVKKQKKSI